MTDRRLVPTKQEELEARRRVSRALRETQQKVPWFKPYRAFVER